MLLSKQALLVMALIILLKYLKHLLSCSSLPPHWVNQWESRGAGNAGTTGHGQKSHRVDMGININMVISIFTHSLINPERLVLSPISQTEKLRQWEVM